jgi:hypothetical protein
VTDYYVDANHPKAADTNPGTRDQPWKTVQHAADSVDLGVTVHVMPGVYPESVAIGPEIVEGGKRRPRAGKGAITFIADGDGPAIIDGAAHLKPDDFKPTDEKGVFSWTPPEPFPFYGAGAPPQWLSWVFIDDTRLILKECVYPLLAFNPRTGEDDILDWKALAKRLKDAGAAETPSPARRVWDLLPANSRQALESGPADGFTDDQKRSLVGALNALIARQKDLYLPESFPGVSLPPEAEALRQGAPASLAGEKLAEFNRLVLESAFPKEIARRKPPLATSDTWSFLRGKDCILVNFNGRSVPKDLDIQVSFRQFGFVVRDIGGSQPLKAPALLVKGFVLNRQIGQAIALQCGQSCVFEDCHVIQPGMHGIVTGGSTAPHAFRRIRVYDSTMWGSNFFGNGHTVQELVYQSCGQRIDPAGEPWVGVLKSNGGSFQTVRHNLIIDRPPKRWKVGNRWAERDKYDFPFSGIWGDCNNADNRIYGNCSARVPHAGIYVEAEMNRNFVLWNVIQDSGMGITFRCSANNVVTQNWIFDGEALGLGQVDTDMMAGWGHEAKDHEWWGREIMDGLCLWQTNIAHGSMSNFIFRNLVQVSGRYVSLPVPTWLTDQAVADAARIMCLKDASTLKEQSAARIDYRQAAPQSYQSPLNNYLNGNYYVTNRQKSAWNAGFALYLDRQIETFEEFQQITGLEETGKAGQFAPADIGLQICWTVPPDTRFPGRLVAFDYDGGAERAAPRPAAAGHEFWADGAVEPYSWFRASGDLRDDPPDGFRVWTQWPACKSGMRALGAVNSGKPESIPAVGKGWRTISFPVSPGTTMRVSLFVRAAEVKPAKPGEGVEVFAHFCDWTGHHVSREWLVGNGANPGLTEGTCDWTQVEKSVKVPKDARRMAVYAGLKPATGTLLIDDLVINLEKPAPPELLRAPRKASEPAEKASQPASEAKPAQPRPAKRSWKRRP